MIGIERKAISYLELLYKKSLIMYNHSLRVADIATQLCSLVGLNGELKNIIYTGAKYHDIGKLLIPNNVLKKSGSYTEEERREIKRHVEYGYKMMAFIPDVDERILEIVNFHHERLNGSGYPKGLRGKDIPIHVRIVSIADVIASFKENRYHRRAQTTKSLIKHLERGVQKGEYDTEIARAYIKWLKNDIIQKRLHGIQKNLFPV